MMDKEVRTIGQYFNFKTVVSFTVGIVVGVLFAVPLVERGKLGTDFFAGVFDVDENITSEIDTQQEKTTAVREAPVTIVSGENSFVVIDQNAGPSVIMSMASLSQSGWVAIHEETDEGTMGNILGARRFMEGKYFGSAIDLLRRTEGGRSYYAVFHSDDGDSMFDFQTEMPVTDESGAYVSTRFVTTSLEEF